MKVFGLLFFEQTTMFSHIFFFKRYYFGAFGFRMAFEAFESRIWHVFIFKFNIQSTITTYMDNDSIRITISSKAAKFSQESCFSYEHCIGRCYKFLDFDFWSKVLQKFWSFGEGFWIFCCFQVTRPYKSINFG